MLRLITHIVQFMLHVPTAVPMSQLVPVDQDVLKLPLNIYTTKHAFVLETVPV